MATVQTAVQIKPANIQQAVFKIKGGAGNHIAFLDTTNSKVLWVTNETSGQSITIGNPVSFPSLVYTVNQPT